MRHSSVSTWLSAIGHHYGRPYTHFRDSCGEYGFYSQTRSLGVVRCTSSGCSRRCHVQYVQVRAPHVPVRLRTICRLAPLLSPLKCIAAFTLSLSAGHASHSRHGNLRRSPFWQSTLDCNISELIGDRTVPSWEMPPRYCTYAGQGCLSGICRWFHNPNSARRTLAGVTRIRTFCLNVCDVSTHVVGP